MCQSIGEQSRKGSPVNDTSLVSNAFQTFMKDAPAHSQAWLEAVAKLGAASALDAKTQALAYIAVLAAVRLESGLAFHVAEAKAAGASREDVISAVLTGLPAVGNGVTAALPAAIAAYDR
ncbi:carboxymuconolactone decarboxylase family protein [Shinella oryzae]|nr:carboxymuconolactone decarboxylase family protein [Shinella oryzae]